MGKLRYWWCGIGRSAAWHCYYLCQTGDWAWDYGEGSGDDLTVLDFGFTKKNPLIGVFLIVDLVKVGYGLFAVANPAIRYYLPV